MPLYTFNGILSIFNSPLRPHKTYMAFPTAPYRIKKESRFYCLSRLTTSAGPFMCRAVENDGSLVERFGNLWPACTRNLTPFSRKFSPTTSGIRIPVLSHRNIRSNHSTTALPHTVYYILYFFINTPFSS